MSQSFTVWMAEISKPAFWISNITAPAIADETKWGLMIQHVVPSYTAVFEPIEWVWSKLCSTFFKQSGSNCDVISQKKNISFKFSY